MTYLLEKNVYEATKNIILGKVKKNPFLVEFSDWFMKTYSIKVLNAQFGEMPTRFFVIIETTEDYQKMFHSLFHPKEEYETQISNEIKRLALKHNYASKSRLSDIFIKYNDFSVEAKADANSKAIREAKIAIIKKHSMVWDVSAAFYQTVVFYYLDKDVMENQSNGISNAIEDEYFSIAKKYDELNFFTKENTGLKFDSKENVDNNFEGNLFYYFR